MFTVTYKCLRLSFFAPWPRSSLCFGLSPEVTCMYDDWIIERTEYYAKVDPKCVLRDALPTDNPGDRIELSMSTVVDLLKYISETS